MASYCETCATGVAVDGATQCKACLRRAEDAEYAIECETCRIQKLALERYYSGRIDRAHGTLLDFVPKLKRLRFASIDDVAREYQALFTVQGK